MSEHKSVFAELVSTIEDDLLVSKKLFYMNSLLELFSSSKTGTGKSHNV